MTTARRKQEIQDLRIQGRLAHALGRPRSSVPWKPYASMNAEHWLRGWDEEEQERLDAIAAARANEHQRLLDGIHVFEQTGDRVTLASVLRIIAERLPRPE